MIETESPRQEDAPRGRGRPRTVIDWTEFEKLASYHCTQQEIADFFNVTVPTLENACMRDNGETLNSYWASKRGQLKPRLRKIQWQIASEGSAAMAIFLGKQHLGQTDTSIDVEVLKAAQESGMTRDQILDLIKNATTESIAAEKKTFTEFCLTAGYPAPFEKQLEMVDFGLKETSPRLLLGARGYGKTDYVVVLGLAYEVYIDPLNTTTLIVTKSRERNAAMLKEIQSACEKNGVVFAKATSTCLRVHGLLGKDHTVSATTIKTVTLRGRHPKRVIMDDPVTEDDVSEATRMQVERVYNEINKLCSNVLIIGQPAHKFDLYAKLRPLLKKLEVPWGTIPELDHDLEAQRLAGVDEKSIQASYMLQIVSEGATPFDHVKYVDSFPFGDSVAFIDPSHEGGDFTAISIAKGYFDGIAIVGFVWRKAWNHCLDDMTPLLQKYGVKKLAFEMNALGDQPIDVLRTVWPGVGVVGRRSNTNKHSRIMAAGTYAHMIHLSRESHPQYLDQVVQYEYRSKNDDAPDSLASCLQWLGLIRGKE